MSDNDGAFVSTRGTFINAVAAAGGAALFGRLGITPALVVEATGKAERRPKAAFPNAGLPATWCAQGKRAAEHWGRLCNVDITWFDPEWMPGAAKVTPPAAG
jgi:ribose transport system substrate-binding protein